MLRSEGVEVRFVMPPIARTVLQAMGLAKGGGHHEASARFELYRSYFSPRLNV